jgi:fibronectin-binding autotransporter adhesin
MTGGISLDTPATSVTFNQSTAQTVANVISGAGSVIQNGTATLTLSGANTYSGGTTLTGGTIQIGNGGALGAGAVAFDGGTLQVNSGSLITINNAATIDAQGGVIDVINGSVAVFTGNITNATNSSGGTLTITSATGLGGAQFNGNNSYSGPTLVTANGELFAGSTTALSPNSAFTVNGFLTLTGYSNTIQSLSGSGSVVNNNSTAASLTLAATSGTTTFSGTLADSVSGFSGAALALVKTGGSTQILSGANTYTGTTTISAGTLEVDGSIATSIQTTSTAAARSTASAPWAICKSIPAAVSHPARSARPTP